MASVRCTLTTCICNLKDSRQLAELCCLPCWPLWASCLYCGFPCCVLKKLPSACCRASSTTATLWQTRRGQATWVLRQTSMKTSCWSTTGLGLPRARTWLYWQVGWVGLCVLSALPLQDNPDAGVTAAADGTTSDTMAAHTAAFFNEGYASTDSEGPAALLVVDGPRQPHCLELHGLGSLSRFNAGPAAGPLWLHGRSWVAELSPSSRLSSKMCQTSAQQTCCRHLQCARMSLAQVVYF